MFHLISSLLCWFGICKFYAVKMNLCHCVCNFSSISIIFSGVSTIKLYTEFFFFLGVGVDLFFCIQYLLSDVEHSSWPGSLDLVRLKRNLQIKLCYYISTASLSGRGYSQAGSGRGDGSPSGPPLYTSLKLVLFF